MRVDENLSSELIKKYRWAGRIRFVSSVLLFFFLLLIKASGGYTYLNVTLASLVFVEAILNQPYNFFFKRVNIYRFQFYQMLTDIITITWLLYYLGGIEAPVVSAAYYAVILWAGVVSGFQAVFFAVVSSCLFFSSVVILEHFGILPHIGYFSYKVSTAQMLSLLFGNVAFLFAFGYFSAHSSRVIKFLERKRQLESLKYTHRFLTAGYLFSSLAHDLVNHLASVRTYAVILLEKTKSGSLTNKELDTAEALKKIEELESENIKLITQLSRFSRKQKDKQETIDLNNIVEDALVLTLPLAKTSGVAVKTEFAENLPLIIADKSQMQEAFVTLILNSLDTIAKTDKVVIKTLHLKETNSVEVLFLVIDSGFRVDYLKRTTKPVSTYKEETEGESLGFVVAQEIITRHKGKINIESLSGQGTTVTIQFPAA